MKWKDIDMPFCFCWANGRWARTWSNLKGNSWADKYEKKGDLEDNGVLIEQRYGREKEWKAHFEYLLPFFKDERYIKVNGSPVFMFYAHVVIPCLSQMIDYWNRLAAEESISDIYFIGMNNNKYVKGMKALVLFAPHMVWKVEKEEDGMHMIDYDLMWKNIHESQKINGYKTYYCGVPNLDDTPRRGRSSGVLFENFSIDKFYRGMCDIYNKSLNAENEFVFINAWNEWGEGTQLEPDEYYGYSKLEAVYKAQKDVFENNDNKAATSFNTSIAHTDKITNQSDYTITAKCFDQWMSLRENNICISEYLKRYDVIHVAIYGHGMMGRHVITELEGTDIVIDYIIDRNSNRRKSLRYNVISPEDSLPQVDAVIVTIVDEFDSIYQMLKERMNCKFFSLYEIVSELP